MNRFGLRQKLAGTLLAAMAGSITSTAVRAANPQPEPQVNAAGQQILDPTPWVGGVKPFLIESSSQFRTSPPFALSSAEWAREFNEVKSMGSASSAARRPDQQSVKDERGRLVVRIKPELDELLAGRGFEGEFDPVRVRCQRHSPPNGQLFAKAFACSSSIELKIKLRHELRRPGFRSRDCSARYTAFARNPA